MNEKQIQEQLTRLLKQSDDIRAKYDGKPGDMTATEQTEWTNILDEVDKLKGQLANVQRSNAADEWAKKAVNNLPLALGGTGKDLGMNEEEATLKGMEAFRRFLRGGASALRQEDGEAIGRITSTKAYQADNPAGGGFLLVPMQVATGIITLMKDLVFMRALATTFQLTNAESLGFPAIDTDPSDTDWTVELGTGSEETTMAYGRRELKPNPMAKRIKLSNKLIRSAPHVESVIQDRLAYKVAITEEKAFLVGNGANQPLGVFVADANGIPTGRDTVAAGAAAIVADDFLNVTYALKPQYRMNSRWILNRTVLLAARKLKDTTNNYIWSTGLGPGGGLQGTPETLCGRPVMESEYAPGTITTGLYTAILGDFRFYHVVDALDMQLQVLNELYAETNQTGYILRRETDAMPVLGEAFARLRQA
jgi:HK97 family phage major capsid protein